MQRGKSNLKVCFDVSAVASFLEIFCYIMTGWLVKRIESLATSMKTKISQPDAKPATVGLIYNLTEDYAELVGAGMLLAWLFTLYCWSCRSR